MAGYWRVTVIASFAFNTYSFFAIFASIVFVTAARYPNPLLLPFFGYTDTIFLLNVLSLFAFLCVSSLTRQP